MCNFCMLGYREMLDRKKREIISDATHLIVRSRINGHDEMVIIKLMEKHKDMTSQRYDYDFIREVREFVSIYNENISCKDKENKCLNERVRRFGTLVRS